MHKLDQYAEQGNFRAINLLALSQVPLLFVSNFVISFLPIYFGIDTARNLLEHLPEWILEGLEVAGGMMPAVGFAMLLNIMLKRSYVPYFLVGFVFVTYFVLILIGVSFLAVSVAIYEFLYFINNYLFMVE